MKIRDLTNEELARKEDILRSILMVEDNGSKKYEIYWKAWFMLREAGVQRGLFEFFVPGVASNTNKKL